MQGWSESEGISHQTSILKIRKMLAQWKSKNKNVKVKTKKFKCSKPNIRLDYSILSIKIADKNYSCKECEDEINQKGCLTKQHY